ncbi:hypothetical protein C8R48DRAFT_767512 [Suillus tomentosus]|nr:hypothetical protein C8R48DRAFT_767512 [Suillus tomentosus]
MSNDNDNKNVPGIFPLSSPAVVSGLSVDAGTLDLGVESAWTCDKVARAKRSLSLRAEAPTSDQLSTDSWLGALGAPSETNGPPTIDGGEGSAMMSISPILGSVSGLQTSCIRLRTDRNVDVDPNTRNVARQSKENISWFDTPNDNDIGDSEGKVVELNEDAPDTENLFEQWTELKKNIDRGDKPHDRDLDEDLNGPWKDEDRCESLQTQNLALQRYRDLARIEFAEQGNLVEDLMDQVGELRNLVIQSQARESETLKQTQRTYLVPITSEPKEPEPKRETLEATQGTPDQDSPKDSRR